MVDFKVKLIQIPIIPTTNSFLFPPAVIFISFFDAYALF